MPAPARLAVLPQPTPRARPSELTPLDTFLDWWLDTIAPDGLKPGSIDTYRSLSRAIWPDIKATPIGQLAPLDLQVMLSSQLASGRSRSTVGTTRACLSSALKSAAALGLIPVNPMQGVTTPTPSPAKRLRTAAALSLVLNAALIMALAGVAWSWVIVPAVRP